MSDYENYTMIGGKLDGEIRAIDMRIKGKAVKSWNFWTGVDEISTYTKENYTSTVLVFNGTEFREMSVNRRKK